MKQYLDLLKEIKSKGTWKEPAREGMPKTLSLFGTRMEHDMSDGFPLLTTKKMAWKGVVHELLWFLRSDTNIKYLVNNNVHIWDKDAYKWYLKTCKKNNQNPVTFQDFIEIIRRVADEELITLSQQHFFNYDYCLGDLGKVYGYQWRNQNGVDQVEYCLRQLKTNPMGRYAIINAWNLSDVKEMALPPCHLLYQFNCREISFEKRWTSVEKLYDEKAGYPGAMVEDIKDSRELNQVLEHYELPIYYLDLQMYQRSCDTVLGVPFNLASMSCLLMIFAKYLNYVPGKVIWIGGDTHFYDNHLEAVETQLQREPFTLPKMIIKKEIKTLNDIEQLTINDFELIDYVSHEKIEAELSVGV